MISEVLTRTLFDKFRTGRLPLPKFCRQHGISVGAFRKACRTHFPAEYQSVVSARQKKNNRGAYKRGRGFEYEVMRYLESKGYFCARSAGSHSPVDVIALKAQVGWHPLLLVQCKYGDSAKAGDYIPLLDLADAGSGLPLLAWRVPHGTTEWWEVTRIGLSPFSWEPTLFSKESR